MDSKKMQKEKRAEKASTGKRPFNDQGNVSAPPSSKKQRTTVDTVRGSDAKSSKQPVNDENAGVEQLPADQMRPSTASRKPVERAALAGTPSETVDESSEQKNAQEVRQAATKYGNGKKVQPGQSSKSAGAGHWPTNNHFKQLLREELPGVSDAEIRNSRNFVYKKFKEVHVTYKEEVTVKAERDFLSSLSTIPRRYAEVDWNGSTLDGHETFNITGSQKLPRAKQWIYTEKNYISTDSHRLSHIPHLDSYHTSSKELTEKCLKNYKEGIHGSDKGCGEVISHFEVYQLFKGFEDCEDVNEEKDPMIKAKLRFAFFTLFPNTFTYSELKEQHFLTQLEMRFNPDYELPQPETHDEEVKCLANEMCTKCGVVNCPHHNRDPEWSHSFDEPYSGRVSYTFAAKPCSLQCGRELGADVKPNKKTRFESKWLEDMFRSLLRSKPEMCSLTSNLNTMCNLAGHRKFSCHEYTQLARIEAQVPIKPKPRAKHDRQQYLHHQAQLGINPANVVAPCNHPGPCEKAGSACPCVAKKAPCTANCKCGVVCKLQFPGCCCAPGMCGTTLCPCFKGQWECNPLTCKSCHSDIHALGSPTELVCSNIGIQNGWKKKMKVAVSTIPNAGYGLFVQQEVFENELLSDYVGELISDEEAERRGIIDDEMFLSYHFSMWEDGEAVDAYKIGNLMRFANHKFPHENPNCKPKVILLNGVRHIGIYANRDIKAGEELFFNYGYTQDHFARFESAGKKPSKK